MRETIAPARVAALHATLDRQGPAPAPGEPLPPMWHLLFFPEIAGPSDLHEDGQPRSGGFLPDTGLPRRRRAGGRLEYLAPIPVGAEVERVSVLQNVAIKQAAAAAMAIVTVRHEFLVDGALALREEEDLVFRPPWSAEDTPPGEPPTRQERPAFRREVATDPTLLFRYAALTFNGLRIHYDLPYATEREGYPERVVDPALMAQLLADLLRDETRKLPKTFEYRAVAPAFCGQTLTVCGRTLGGKADLWAVSPDGRLALEARVTT
ncbi:acyl dehydratase [uncultured Albimonas sp.]|uniref:acyl dehydratase n=1 Tax=uncultured Albimonas sp. TaxID=1331701 RepID=UPI0030EE8BE8